MSASIYLVNPKSDFPTYFGAETYAACGLRPAMQMADLALPTLAALAPDSMQVSLCDESVSEVDWDTPAQFVGITGKITQLGRMLAIAEGFRSRGKIVMIGGPFASLSPSRVREHCDILVRGEIEEIAGTLFADLESGHWKDEYVGTQPDLSTSPVPKWNGYPLDRAVMGTLQTSRGCPFECEFCDVIQYAGRKQRHKNVGQVIAELDALYARQQRTIFLADDNFTVYRSRAKELLAAIRDWNRRQSEGKVVFFTQVSIDAAKDDELLRLCGEAGVATVFIGIETPNEGSLRETKKRQNVGVDLAAGVHRFLEHGIQVIGGMIVGFDADGPDIFERQFEFAMAAAIPIVTVGALVAPAATPLYDRMRREGRLRSETGSQTAAVPWSTNIVHPTLDEEQLLGGLRRLANRLYDADNFGERLLTFIDKLGPRRDPKAVDRAHGEVHRGVDLDSLQILYMMRGLGPAEHRMWSRVLQAAKRKPDAAGFVHGALLQYMQIRHMYDKGQFWEPQPTAEPAARSPALTQLGRPSPVAGSSPAS